MSERVLRIGTSDTAPVFEGPAVRWASLLQAGRRQALGRGQVLLEPGDRCDRLYYLETGLILVSLTWPDGGEKIIQVVLPGTVFGEAFLFQPDLVTATARAGRASVVYSLGRDEVEGYLRSDPELARALLMSLARQTWVLAKQVEDLRFRSVEARVSSLLHALAARRAADGRPRTIPLTHATLADLVGAHRVSVTNALRDLERRGLVRLHPRRIEVTDPDGLLAFAAIPAATRAVREPPGGRDARLPGERRGRRGAQLPLSRGQYPRRSSSSAGLTLKTSLMAQ
ncbi:MAG: Crp/Fnr family transcriptional regulator [Firmicutes bacterium]|nr:Crp/Fnr family transcriptional regulator [Bacillota bacterium]